MSRAAPPEAAGPAKTGSQIKDSMEGIPPLALSCMSEIEPSYQNDDTLPQSI
jgi:hypothetical protein